MVDMWMALKRTIAGNLDSYWCTESPTVFHIGDSTTPTLIRCHFYIRMLEMVIQIASILKSVTPEFRAERAVIQETSHHSSKGMVWSFTAFILGRVISTSRFKDACLPKFFGTG